MVLVKLCSRWSAESITSFTFCSAAATCAWRKSLDFPIWTAKRSVGVGEVRLRVFSGEVVDRRDCVGREGEGSKSS